MYLILLSVGESNTKASGELQSSELLVLADCVDSSQWNGAMMRTA